MWKQPETFQIPLGTLSLPQMWHMLKTPLTSLASVEEKKFWFAISGVLPCNAGDKVALGQD
jgi:hypothetical protein